MNLAHVHLILNHLPVVGIPLALAFLLYGRLRKDSVTQRFALLVLFATAAVVVPVYLTGEPAEKTVERLAGIPETLIEAHEEAALASMILTVIAGSGAFAALLLARREGMYRVAVLGTMVLATIAAGSLAYTANLGGNIRHSEIRTAAVAQADSGGDMGRQDKCEDDD